MALQRCSFSVRCDISGSWWAKTSHSSHSMTLSLRRFWIPALPSFASPPPSLGGAQPSCCSRRWKATAILCHRKTSSCLQAFISAVPADVRPSLKFSYLERRKGSYAFVETSFAPYRVVWRRLSRGSSATCGNTAHQMGRALPFTDRTPDRDDLAAPDLVARARHGHASRRRPIAS